jgi:hydroxymethylpyrimidine pyrophosphatase-like HAD family hydrolase
MIDLLRQLLDKYKVAIITWWDFLQIGKQIFNYFDKNITNLNNLYLFPTCWAKMYKYFNWDFIIQYSEDLTDIESKKIILFLDKAVENLNLKLEKSYWKTVENRWTQITYSAIWQDCPLEIKSVWDPDCKKRQKIRDYIKDDLREFQIWIAGKSSIDITRKWIDKSYWIKKIINELGIKKEEILFIWDMLMPGWNDYPVKEYWVECIEVKNPEDTKNIIKKLLN